MLSGDISEYQALLSCPSLCSLNPYVPSEGSVRCPDASAVRIPGAGSQCPRWVQPPVPETDARGRPSTAAAVVL